MLMTTVGFSGLFLMCILTKTENYRVWDKFFSMIGIHQSQT